MGLDLRIEDENGVVLSELLDSNEIFKNISKSAHESSICLRFLDPYGDTVFNRLQIPLLIQELMEFRKTCTDGRLNSHIEEAVLLIEKNLKNLHTYVKFYGD